MFFGVYLLLLKRFFSNAIDIFHVASSKQISEDAVVVVIISTQATYLSCQTKALCEID